MLKIEELETQLKNKKIENLYLLYGEEQYLIDQCAKKIKGIFGDCVKGINYIQIDQNNVSELISDIETPSFGYEKKLIIAKNTGLFSKENKRNAETRKKSSESGSLKTQLNTYISENIELIKQSVILVFIEEDAEKSDLYKTIEKSGTVCQFDFQKPMQLISRIKAICNQYDVKVENYVLQYFIESERYKYAGPHK